MFPNLSYDLTFTEFHQNCFMEGKLTSMCDMKRNCKKHNFFSDSKQLRQVAKMPTGSYLQPKNPECKVCTSLSLLSF